MNTVASIMKIFAIINAIGGIVLGIMLGDNYGAGIGLTAVFAVAVASFFIYAFGEVIDLLQDIKYNTMRQSIDITSAKYTMAAQGAKEALNGQEQEVISREETPPDGGDEKTAAEAAEDPDSLQSEKCPEEKEEQ